MAVNYNTSIVKDGLVLYLDAANPKSYPGTGTTWFDLKQNTNGNIQNGATFSNNSFIFDGVNDVVSLSNNVFTQFPHNSAWSIQLMGKVISQNASFPGFIYKGASVTSGILLFYTTAGDFNTLYFKHNNSQIAVNIPVNSIFFYTLTYSGSGLTKIYLGDQFIRDAINIVSTETSNNLFLGRGDAFGNGQIYNFLKYNRELSLLEIQKNFSAFRGRYGI